MALMLEGVLADRLTKNEMLPYWLKGKKKLIKHCAVQSHLTPSLQKIRVSKHFFSEHKSQETVSE